MNASSWARAVAAEGSKQARESAAAMAGEQAPLPKLETSVLFEALKLAGSTGLDSANVHASPVPAQTN